MFFELDSFLETRDRNSKALLWSETKLIHPTMVFFFVLGGL
jgi:hypothetical protein